MKIRISSLRNVIRSVIKEAQDTPTVSADLDPGERTLRNQFPRWGTTGSRELNPGSPAKVKAKQVTRILADRGVTSDAAQKKRVTQELQSFIEDMDPSDMFAAPADDIADAFASRVLGIKTDRS